MYSCQNWCLCTSITCKHFQFLMIAKRKTWECRIGRLVWVCSRSSVWVTGDWVRSRMCHVRRMLMMMNCFSWNVGLPVNWARCRLTGQHLQGNDWFLVHRTVGCQLLMSSITMISVSGMVKGKLCQKVNYANSKHFYLPNPSHQFNFSPCNFCTVS